MIVFRVMTMMPVAMSLVIVFATSPMPPLSPLTTLAVSMA